MATIGWAPGGSTQLGSGIQLPAASWVRSGFSHTGRYVKTESSLGQWIEAARTAPQPTAAANVRDMEGLMSSAKRWPTAAVSDLSGGKDSRVIAAMGIRSRSIAAVRTIASDHGEVETAKILMSCIDTRVEHHIVEKTNRSTGTGLSVVERLSSQHAAFEGRYLPASGFNSAGFTGFRSAKQAKFNGLGGEVMNGGSFTRGPWREKLEGAPISEAGGRIVKMISGGLSASQTAKDAVREFAETYPEKVSKLSGINTASGVLDLFYNIDRMPNWSNVFAGTDTLCPFFASSIVALGARNIGSPVADGELHTMFLAEAIPSWAKVPFYKPSGRVKRVLPMVWENKDWADIRQFILDNADRLISFSPEGIKSLIMDIDAQMVTPRHEVAIHRFLWNASFESYELGIAADAKAVRVALSQQSP